MGTGSRIIAGLHDAVRGNMTRILIDGQVWVRHAAGSPDALLSASAAPSAEPALPVWQPIATAPKDGTRIVILAHLSEGVAAFVARFSESMFPWITDGNDAIASRFVTHWMPLPPATSADPSKAEV